MTMVEMFRVRSEAQRIASRANGSSSHGPKTDIGKSISAMNAVRTGIDARSTVMPDERLEDHQLEADIWGETFGSKTGGEARIVHAISDLWIRVGRVDREEERQRIAGVATELRRTEAFKDFSSASDALAAVRGLAETAESIKTTVPFEHLGQLAPAMRRTLELVEGADVPVALLVPLRDGMNEVSLAALLDAGPEEFSRVAVAARDVEAWLAMACATLRAVVEDTRGRMLADPILGDDAVLRRLDRHRARLHRQLDAQLDLLRKVRELASTVHDPSGSFVRVELRVVGGPNLARR